MQRSLHRSVSHAASPGKPRRGSTRADVTAGGDHRGAPHGFLARLEIPEARDTFPEPGDEVCGRMFPESEDDVKAENTRRKLSSSSIRSPTLVVRWKLL